MESNKDLEFIFSKIATGLSSINERFNYVNCETELIKSTIDRFEVEIFSKELTQIKENFNKRIDDIDKVVEVIISVFTFVEKYKFLAFSEDFLPQDSIIRKEIDFKFISLKLMDEALEKINQLGMIEYSVHVLKLSCVRYVENRFFKVMLRNVFENLHRELQKGRNRIKNLSSEENKNSDSQFGNEFIHFLELLGLRVDNFEQLNVFNPKSALRKSINPNKDKYNMNEINEAIHDLLPMSLTAKKNSNFKLGEFSEAQADLIRIIEPRFIINTLEELHDLTTYINTRGQYHSKYLNKRVKSFGLFKLDKKMKN